MAGGHPIQSGRGADEEEGSGVFARAGWRNEHPALVLLALNLIGDEREAELLHELGDRLVIVANYEGDAGEGSGISNQLLGGSVIATSPDR